MRKNKFLAFVSVISCIALLSSIALIPTPAAAANTTEDLVLYSNDFQSNAGVESNAYVNAALQYEDSSISSFNSNNKYLKVDSAKSTWIKAFTELPNNSFNCGDSLTQDDILVTKQTFRFNLAKSTRVNNGGSYAAVYCYWYKNDNSYQQIAIGRKTAPSGDADGKIGVWIQHDYEGYSKYYTAKNTPYSSATRQTTSATRELFKDTINYDSNNINKWFTCTITFESATKVTITLQRDGEEEVYTQTFEDYTLAPQSWFYTNADATSRVTNVQTENFTDGLVSEDLRKTKTIGFGVATNVKASGSDTAMFDDVEVIMDAETYAAKLAEKQEAAQAEAKANAFKSNYADILSLEKTDFEALYTSDISKFRLNAEKISAALREYEAASDAVKNKLADEHSTLSSLAEAAEKYAYAYGEAYFDDFNDSTAENWVIIDEAGTLARAKAVLATASKNVAKFETGSDGTNAYRPASIQSSTNYENMSIRLITMLTPSLYVNRGVYDLGTISFDSKLYNQQNNKYIYWYKDENNYKWFETHNNGGWGTYLRYGAVINGYTVTTKNGALGYDGAGIPSSSTSVPNGTPIHIVLEYRADGAYISGYVTKDSVEYKLAAVNLDKSITIKKSDNETISYSSYAELETAESSLVGISNSSTVSAAFGVSTTTWSTAKAIDNVKMTYNLPFTLSMEKGAYLYTSSPYGIKFVCNVAANSYYRGANNIELLDAGILYIPTKALESGERLTYERTLVANSKNTKAFAVSASIVDSATAPSSINGSLLNVADLMPKTDFTTRGYIRYRLTTDAEDVYRVMYTDENSVSRSVLTTAQNACIANKTASPEAWEGITEDTIKAYTIEEALEALREREIIG